ARADATVSETVISRAGTSRSDTEGTFDRPENQLEESPAGSDDLSSEPLVAIVEPCALRSATASLRPGLTAILVSLLSSAAGSMTTKTLPMMSRPCSGC